MQRHTHQEFIRFLNAVERAVPAGKLVHAILDNYGTHKHPKVKAWLARHPRWIFHFTPKSGEVCVDSGHLVIRLFSFGRSFSSGLVAIAVPRRSKVSREGTSCSAGRADKFSASK